MARTERGLRAEILDRFERELELVGSLDDEQRARLLEIANRCPVHRTLEEGPALITTHLLDAREVDEVAG